jgi:hypothetical protein
VVRPESAKLSFVGSIPTRTSILFLFAGALWGMEPEAILEAALNVQRELRPKLQPYLGQEDIRYFQVMASGRRKQTGWETYDVFAGARGPAYRLVARNGKPVKSGGPARRGERGRMAFPVEDLRHNHTLSLRGEATLLGRRCWVLEAMLDPSAPDIVDRARGMTASDATLWIDQETFWILQQEARLRRFWANFAEGSLVTREALFHDGLPLTGLIRLRLLSPADRNGRRIVRETEQSYSRYRRFGAESTIEFSPVQ